MTTNEPMLPAESVELFSPPSFQGADAGEVFTPPETKIAHSQAKWDFGGVLQPELAFTFVTRRKFRELFEKEYDPRVKDTNPQIACASFDGSVGYGRGSRDMSAKIQKRSCDQCPSSIRPLNGKWLCPPNVDYFLMVRGDNGLFLPTFYVATGTNVYPFNKAYSAAEFAMRKMGEMQGGKACFPYPRYMFEMRARLIGKGAYSTAEISDPVLLKLDECKQVHHMVSNGGVAMWNDHNQQWKDLIHSRMGSASQSITVAERPAGKESDHGDVPPEPSEPVDYKDVPF